MIVFLPRFPYVPTNGKEKAQGSYQWLTVPTGVPTSHTTDRSSTGGINAGLWFQIRTVSREKGSVSRNIAANAGRSTSSERLPRLNGSDSVQGPSVYDGTEGLGTGPARQQAAEITNNSVSDIKIRECPVAAPIKGIHHLLR